MERHRRPSSSPVPIGSIKIRSKIIFSTVSPSPFHPSKSSLSIVVGSNDSSRQLMIAGSPISTFAVYLPSNDNLQLLIYIRDAQDCLTKWNLPVVIGEADPNAFDALLRPGSVLRSIPSQNRVGQLLISLSHQLNQLDEDNLRKAISSSCSIFLISSSILRSRRWSSCDECLVDLPVTSWNTTQLQSGILAQLTQSTDQLTLSFLVRNATISSRKLNRFGR